VARALGPSPRRLAVTRAASLLGWRVAVTRPADGADELADRLRAAGAVPVVVALVEVAGPADPAPLRLAAAGIAAYDWIVFTSANGVRHLHDALAAGGRLPSASAPPPGRIAAVGPATARAVEALLGWTVHVVPGRFVGDAVAAAMAKVAPLAGARVLWPRAESARPVLPRELRAAGATLDAPVAYRTVADPAAARRLSQLLAAGQIDIVTLTSPSAVDCLAAVRPPLDRAIVAVIGPTTGAAARARGLPVHIEPEQHTIPGLVDALARYLRDRGADGGALPMNHE
jgi:uroporphyrinogen-III synthase